MFKLLTALLILAAISVAQPPKAQAFDFFRTVCPGKVAATTGPQKGQSSPVCDQNQGQDGSDPAINIIQITTSVFALLAGILALFMIIVSGFQMVTSQGNTEAVSNARKRLVNSIVGVVLVALAWTIIRLVTDRIIQG